MQLIAIIAIFVAKYSRLMTQQPAHKASVSFDDTEAAFRRKDDKSLNKAYWIFRVIANNFLTRIGPPLTNFAFKAGLPITGIIRKTFFQHFCGGESIAGCRPAILQLATQGVSTILDYSVEGEESEASFDETCEEILRTVTYAKVNQNISFCVFKPTGLGSFDLYKKVSASETLSPDETAAYNRVKARIERICQACYYAGMKLLIDAEHSWIQDAIDDLTRDMMRRFNREKIVVYNTYQIYRHDKLASLKADHAVAETDGFMLGAKLVRGAYMEIERERAEEKGYPSPIQPNKPATDHDYDQALLFCLDHIDRVGLMAGTHNEASSQLLATEMDKRGLMRNHPNIHFAQLLGMSDHISFNLGEGGYNVAKYMPYGPVKAVMPYLFRRAAENTSVAGQTSRELQLIIKEKKRRKAAPKNGRR